MSLCFGYCIDTLGSERGQTEQSGIVTCDAFASSKVGECVPPDPGASQEDVMFCTAKSRRAVNLDEDCH